MCILMCVYTNVYNHDDSLLYIMMLNINYIYMYTVSMIYYLLKLPFLEFLKIFKNRH